MEQGRATWGKMGNYNRTAIKKKKYVLKHFIQTSEDGTDNFILDYSHY